MTIKEIRQKALLTQQEFAEELGISRSSIAAWETQGRKPTMRNQRAIKEFCEKNGIATDNETN